MKLHPDLAPVTSWQLPSALLAPPTSAGTGAMCLAWLAASPTSRVPSATRVELALLYAAAERFNLAVPHVSPDVVEEVVALVADPLESGGVRVRAAWESLAAGAEGDTVSTESLVRFHDVIRAVRIEHESTWASARRFLGPVDVTSEPFGGLPWNR